jgi:alpha-tubulin suppressor-like RCC1 family protein
VVAIGAGEDFVLALEQDGSVWIWGAGDEADSSAPTEVKGLSDAMPVSAEGEEAYAVLSDGTTVNLAGDE